MKNVRADGMDTDRPLNKFFDIPKSKLISGEIIIIALINRISKVVFFAFSKSEPNNALFHCSLGLREFPIHAIGITISDKMKKITMLKNP